MFGVQKSKNLEVTKLVSLVQMAEIVPMYLEIHYENTPIQYYGTFWLQKRKVLDERMCSLLFLLETKIVCTR